MQPFLLLLCVASAAEVSPIEKVLTLIGELQAKVISDGDAQQIIYENFTDFCNDDSRKIQHELKNGNAMAERLSAKMDEAASSITELATKIESLTSSIASDEADLKEATALRAKEHASFLKSDESLAGTVSSLGRAISIIEKEQGGGASLLQANTGRVAAALQSLVAAQDVDSLDKAKVQALLQESTDDDLAQPAGAPDPAAFENQSGGIMSVLEDMLEKVQAQQSEAQKAEMEAAHAFSMLKMGLTDALAQQNQELADAKKASALAEETKAQAEGELERTKKELTGDTKTLKDLQHECMTKAEEFELEQKERSAELEALATAKKILEETTGGAAKKTYDFTQVASFVQLSSEASKSGDRVVMLLQQVSKSTKAKEISALALRIRATLASSSDPFGKVKGMINEMLEKLIKEAQEEAEKKAFCDKEMAETEAKKADKSSEVDDLQTTIDKFAAKIAKLTERIATLEAELGEISNSQKEATTLRQAEKQAWLKAKDDFEKGLGGVQMALQVLRDYYAQKDDAALVQTDQPASEDMRAQMSSEVSLLATTSQAATTGASGIIGMLEVAESDFTKMLAEGQSAEDQAEKEYESVSDDNKEAKMTKSTEAKLSAKNKKETEALLSDTKEDLSVAHEELDAILEYYEKLRPQCVAKPEPYEERKKRREEEIAGLKEAGEILEAESAPAFLAVRRS